MKPGPVTTCTVPGGGPSAGSGVRALPSRREARFRRNSSRLSGIGVLLGCSVIAHGTGTPAICFQKGAALLTRGSPSRLLHDVRMGAKEGQVKVSKQMSRAPYAKRPVEVTGRFGVRSAS